MTITVIKETPLVACHPVMADFVKAKVKHIYFPSYTDITVN